MSFKLKPEEVKLQASVAYQTDIISLLTKYQSSSLGLSEQKALDNFGKYGPNKILEKKTYSILKILLAQFSSILILILVSAAIFSWYIGEIVDSIAILLIVLINGLLGFFQEYKAEKTIDSLKKIEISKCRVLREGIEISLEAEKIVPGDILILYEGEKIPADARILESFNLEINESMLTGESVAVSKNNQTIKNKVALADRLNMLYSGTTIVKGHGKALVLSTGMNTELGQIAFEIQKTVEEETPLQKTLNKLGKVLASLSLLIAIPGFLFGLAKGREVHELLITTISLAVSAIPEGLPIVVTIALALGIKKMTKVNVLIRKLATAESLGGTHVICTDKTGTLTHNQMTVTKMFVQNSGFYEVTGKGYSTTGKIFYDNEENLKFPFLVQKDDQEKLKASLLNFVLCSNATLDFGDPTERALVVLAKKYHLDNNDLNKNFRKIAEIPFDSIKKYMTVTVKSNGDVYQIIKGAPEYILEKCQLDDEIKKQILKVNQAFSSEGLRNLAVAYTDQQNIFHFQALVGMYDPPRKEVSEAIKTCNQAGIRVIILTGDHPGTAISIAKQIGLKTSACITGIQLDELNDIDFGKIMQKVNVFARVSPHHKVRILEFLQNLDLTVAMTGDGVNDAMAIKRADTGIAVGSGTDLTKEVSDMILLDDNFASISKAIQVGRTIFFNIKKFIIFLLSANFDEIFETLFAIIFALPLPYLPLHILFINLITDSLPALALTKEKSTPDIMEKKPYDSQKEITHGVISQAVFAGIVDFIITFGLYLVYLFVFKVPIAHARTINFTTAILFEFMLVYIIRSDKFILNSQLLANKYLNYSVVIGLICQLLVIYTPVGQMIFKTVSLSWLDWAIMGTAVLVAIIPLEIRKAFNHQ